MARLDTIPANNPPKNNVCRGLSLRLFQPPVAAREETEEVLHVGSLSLFHHVSASRLV